MRRRLLLNKKSVASDGVSVGEAQACDVVFCKSDGKTLVIRRDQKDWKIDETPIGIVVIPASHGVLKDGTGTVNQCGVMSLVPMDYNNPEKGGTSNKTMYWGGYGVELKDKADGLGRYDSVTRGLLNYHHLVTTVDNKSNVAGGYSINYQAYIPIQNSIGSIPTRNNSPYAPSPYIGDDYKSGGYNESYGLKDGVVVTESNNVLSDFSGIVNTKIITDQVTVSNWKILSKIANSSASGNYPAACCCARYKTIGTKSFIDCSIEELNEGTGFWYLPSAGESGYILPRRADIDDIISKLKTSYGIGVLTVTNSDGILSSSQYTLYVSYSFNVNIGSVNGLPKNNDIHSVRAFLRLSPEDIQEPEKEDIETVDMGLSVDWSTCNLGALSPEESGWYFQWGDTEPFDSNRKSIETGQVKSFDWANYKWCNGSDTTLTKYCTKSDYGTVDNKTVLDPEDDAATVLLGEEYRIPTEAEFQELLDACDTQGVTNYNGTGINGRLFTLKSDPTKTLFFPLTGDLFGNRLDNATLNGFYYTSSLHSTNPNYGMCLNSNSSNCFVSYVNRYVGMVIRPIKIKSKQSQPEPDNGVYIESVDGELYTRSAWDGSKTANSVVVITDECKVRVALTEASSTMKIHSTYSGALENYMIAISNETNAKADYKGKENTENIMKLQSSTDYAAGWCANYTFPDGKTKGYLPALGEWWTVYQNKAEVDACLKACGGTSMNTNYYWTSTFYGVDGSYRTCWIFSWSGGYMTYNYLGNEHLYTPLVRPFAQYSLDE